jgi:hypothetical protein
MTQKDTRRGGGGGTGVQKIVQKFNKGMPLIVSLTLSQYKSIRSNLPPSTLSLVMSTVYLLESSASKFSWFQLSSNLVLKFILTPGPDSPLAHLMMMPHSLPRISLLKRTRSLKVAPTAAPTTAVAIVAIKSVKDRLVLRPVL